MILSVLDRKWREHLYEMDYLRDGIGLRAMAQRDPLIEYQREGFDLFRAMMDSIKEETVGLLFNLEVTVGEPEEPEEELELGAGDARGVIRPLGAGPSSRWSSRGSRAGAWLRPRPPPRPRLRRRPRLPRRRRCRSAEVPARGGARSADRTPPGLGPRRPDHVQYTAPSETGEATVVGESGGGQFAGVGRNEMCPCGSGKKFKRCHGDPRLRD